jgi:hypothetical protein
MLAHILLLCESFLVALAEIALTIYYTFTDEDKCQMPLNTWLIVHMTIIMLVVIYLNKDVDFENRKLIILASIHLVILMICIFIGALMIAFPGDCGELDHNRYLLIQVIIFEYFLKLVATILWLIFHKRTEYKLIKTIKESTEEGIEKIPQMQRAYSV